jgi:hypothetical protein
VSGTSISSAHQPLLALMAEIAAQDLREPGVEQKPTKK